MTTSTSAASFIDQIKAAYSEVVKAETSALPHAIRCGEFLNLAKENLKAERGGKWSDWLETNCPEIAQETASLYMRLAANKKLVVKAKSIAEARKLLPKQNPRGEPPKPDAKKPSGGFDPEPQQPKGPTFEDELEIRAPDEIFPLLVAHWEDDDLRKLLINDHLAKKPAAGAEISTARTNSPSKPPITLEMAGLAPKAASETLIRREGRP